MSVDVGAFHAAAIGVCTELTLGECDLDVIAALIADLPEETASRLILLVATFGDILHIAGPDALRSAGLHAAQLQLGVDP
ncbi:hypothetical protein JNW91_16785 [Micromonospora sp. STR1_7]|uniref:Uncharacterized protein n=1 Tax=Micromonospora parastrephiae TaxID=2806101 RepID=A0ABS1XVS7_9ACTN|nr:hypothetical protein [Micromonospora parastrephiae]MBM0233365.1 hypothetical protein [Micromonospora parastrephiae]